jgi:hypothetical protein
MRNEQDKPVGKVYRGASEEEHSAGERKAIWVEQPNGERYPLPVSSQGYLPAGCISSAESFRGLFTARETGQAAISAGGYGRSSGSPRGIVCVPHCPAGRLE